jgi:hypothetical protein
LDSPFSPAKAELTNTQATSPMRNKSLISLSILQRAGQMLAQWDSSVWSAGVAKVNMLDRRFEITSRDQYLYA